MKQFIFCAVAVLFCSISSFAQNTLTVSVVDSASGAAIVGANVLVSGTKLGGATDVNGKATIAEIPRGPQTIAVSAVGYKTYNVNMVFPLPKNFDTLQVKLTQTNVELEGVTVTTTRTSYHLNDSPERVEVRGPDDIAETAVDHPANISEIFLESTGIQVLQTSAVSNYVSIKLQGLDGSYTQILKDGFPLYGGLSSDLSVTQIPPLDLQRVEVIKGPSSSLYGGGAIAGLINLISKKPSEKGEFTLLLNGNTSSGLNAGAFYSKQNDDLGATILFTGNLNAEYDGDHTGFSDIPESQYFTFNPKIFYDLSGKTKLMFGLSTTYDNLVGGDMTAIRNGASVFHPYIEKSKSNRTYTQLQLNSSLSDGTTLSFKNSIGYFLLNSSIESDKFYGAQWTSFSELSLQTVSNRNTLTGGLNLTTDDFLENFSYSGMNRSYSRWTAGVFGQDDWQIVPPFTLEAGLRIDRENVYGLQALPRIAGIYRLTNELGFRASFGLGYKVPTIFSDQSDPDAIYSMGPVGSNVKVEKSIGGEFDINYNAFLFGNLSLNIDQAFFYTRVNSPLVLDTTASSSQSRYALKNADGFIFSKGAETDMKLNDGDLEAFIGYTYTDAERNFSSVSRELYLTPPTKFVTDIMYDVEDFGEAGVEIRYTGTQLLHGGTKSPGFWVSDLLFEKKLSHLMFFAAVENVFNFKQINYTPVVTGSLSNPRFNDVWAPIEGRVMNVGVKIEM
jgi:outer membrane receptor for ferrienterochelin and colicins